MCFLRLTKFLNAMKKLSALLVLAALMLLSCTKEKIELAPKEPNARQVETKITLSQAIDEVDAFFDETDLQSRGVARRKVGS